MNGKIGEIVRMILDYPGNREKYRDFANDGSRSSEKFTVRLRGGREKEIELFKGAPRSETSRSR